MMRSRQRRSRIVGAMVGGLMALATTGLVEAADPLDWPNWLGPEHNRISREVGLAEDMDPRGDSLLWKSEELGTRSTPVVMNGRLYMLCRADPGTPIEGEKVVCADPETGEILWENKFGVFLSDVPDTRVAWSSVVGDPETGNVYALGVCDYFQCINGETGETIWSRPLNEEFGMLNTYGGRTNVPVVFEDLVIVSGVIIGWGEAAKPTHRFIAFDKRTGEVIWFNGTRPLPYDTTYSTPVLAVLDGQAALVFGSGDGAVWAFQPRTGQPIWHYRLARRGLNGSPLVHDNVVYAGNTEENINDNTMGAVVAIDGTGEGDVTESGEIWRVKEVVAGKSSPLVIDERLYIVDDMAGLWIFDAKTGEQIGRRKTKLGTVMRSTPLYADGKLYCTTANGRWYVLEPTEDGVKKLAQGRYSRGEECPGSPIVSHGRLFVPTTLQLYCFAKPNGAASAEPRPESPQETPVEDDPEVAHVQVVPAELLLHPGDEQQFKVRLYNSRGQRLETADAEIEYSVDQAGTIDSEGHFKADPNAAHVAAYVTAKVGEISGQARVRVVPDLPWTFDFSNEEIPITFVGIRYRHVIRDLDGDPAMVKITTIPKGTRSQGWMGHSDFHDYTIEADVMGAESENKMPDIGLIAQRYTLDLMGASQQLQIRTWTPQLRMAQTVPFEWQPNVWYRMKLKAANENGKAVLRGKVWPRDAEEPAEWTVEAVDEMPNTEGSPGLFGNAKDAEIFLDNIRVVPNEG